MKEQPPSYDVLEELKKFDDESDQSPIHNALPVSPPLIFDYANLDSQPSESASRNLQKDKLPIFGTHDYSIMKELQPPM